MAIGTQQDRGGANGWFDPMRYVLVAADSIEQLRGSARGIYRVLEFAHSEGKLGEMAACLGKQRPDLTDTVWDCMVELLEQF
ncbi:MAG: hypothetical protein LBE22_03735 [Azoarcus sp.]|jgi:hypothetical protein|nr:hypothetical protein [Azoarcus sp.]